MQSTTRWFVGMEQVKFGKILANVVGIKKHSFKIQFPNGKVGFIFAHELKEMDEDYIAEWGKWNYCKVPKVVPALVDKKVVLARKA